jgi:uncharacterized protein YecE (DUF72 family)
MSGGQLSLFDDDVPDGRREASRSRRPVAAVEPVPIEDDLAALAAVLPSGIHLGTSSWSFPGWTGLVYAARDGRPESEQRLARAGLPAYVACPLFRTVSLDRTFYAPLSQDEFARYASQVPASFRFVVKAPSAFTDPVIRGGTGGAMRDNPTFLDAHAAATTFVQPAMAGLGATAGPLVFQFPPLGRRLLATPARVVTRIAAFLGSLPRGPLYAAEFRDPELVTAACGVALADAGAVPCLAIHARMPPATAQATTFELDRPGCTWPLVARWNLHAGRGYEEARADYFPFDRLVEEDGSSRTALAGLARRCAAAGRDVFITINNKAEGSAPLSVRRLAEAIRAHV